MPLSVLWLNFLCLSLGRFAPLLRRPIIPTQLSLAEGGVALLSWVLRTLFFAFSKEIGAPLHSSKPYL